MYRYGVERAEDGYLLDDFGRSGLKLPKGTGVIWDGYRHVELLFGHFKHLHEGAVH